VENSRSSRPWQRELSLHMCRWGCRALTRYVCLRCRHMAALVDIMMARGQIVAITLHCINHRNMSPIAQTAFEETVDILFRAAALFSEYDSWHAEQDA
jgi:hypothetical protein